MFKAKRLDRQQVVTLVLGYGNLFASENGMRVTAIDCTDNPLAPETYYYKVSYINTLTGKRNKISLFPNTVGYQGCR